MSTTRYGSLESGRILFFYLQQLETTFFFYFGKLHYNYLEENIIDEKEHSAEKDEEHKQTCRYGVGKDVKPWKQWVIFHKPQWNCSDNFMPANLEHC